ncbi:hypothetical protein AAG570_007022 [Ranatra chinensis]|uniref:Uncharacterized protein n=1 Tax=Ranatra chinensis TaxID=642074 RepID=A0ABD0YVR7_9HEMI
MKRLLNEKRRGYYANLSDQKLTSSSARMVTTVMIMYLLRIQLPDCRLLLLERGLDDVAVSMSELPCLKTEIQFLIKLALYLFNAPHSWPYALGILHFLLEAVESINSIDAEALLFPDSFLTDAKDEECLWDRKDFPEMRHYIVLKNVCCLGS